MRIVSINTGPPRLLGDPAAREPERRPWRSAIYKVPVRGPVQVGLWNLEGDGQADLRVHGGRDKALLACSAEHYPLWRSELDLPEIGPGGFGENLTISGATEEDVCLGDVWEIGAVRLQVSQPRQPCWKLARRWDRPGLPKRVVNSGRTGWYLRVLNPGEIEAGMECRRIERPAPEWTLARANRALFDRCFPAEQAAELAALPELAESWKEDLLGKRGLGGAR